MTPVPTQLDAIVFDVRMRLAERRSRLSAKALAREVVPDPGRRQRFLESLSAPGLSVIAECKRRSPSRGALADGAELDWTGRASAYASGGAAALSILTEEDHFGGALEHLEEARSSGLPLLRKDFLIDPSMVHEAWLHGADAVLLLPCILDQSRLIELFHCALACELATLFEVHDERELERVLALEPEVIGVNARDLTSFEVDLRTVERLLPLIPPAVLRVAESGLQGPEELIRVRAAGADAALVGEALMVSDDPAATLRSWREVVVG